MTGRRTVRRQLAVASHSPTCNLTRAMVAMVVVAVAMTAPVVLLVVMVMAVMMVVMVGVVWSRRW